MKKQNDAKNATHKMLTVDQRDRLDSADVERIQRAAELQQAEANYRAAVAKRNLEVSRVLKELGVPQTWIIEECDAGWRARPMTAEEKALVDKRG